MSTVFSRITSKAQTTVPKAVREALGAGPGDALAYRVEGGKVLLTKAPALDLAYLKSVESSLADEWASDQDSEAFDDL
jgi:AbrB family looped-hinge helix DNA binding protein